MRPIGQAGRLRPSDLLRPVQVRCLAAPQPGVPGDKMTCYNLPPICNLQATIYNSHGQGSGFRPRGLRHGAPALSWLSYSLPGPPGRFRADGPALFRRMLYL